MEQKIKEVELVVCENSELKSQLKEVTITANKAEAENKMLIDRWMLEKMKDAERLNEVYTISYSHPHTSFETRYYYCTFCVNEFGFDKWQNLDKNILPE